MLSRLALLPQQGADASRVRSSRQPPSATLGLADAPGEGGERTIGPSKRAARVAFRVGSILSSLSCLSRLMLLTRPGTTETVSGPEASATGEVTAVLATRGVQVLRRAATPGSRGTARGFPLSGSGYRAVAVSRVDVPVGRKRGCLYPPWVGMSACFGVSPIAEVAPRRPPVSSTAGSRGKGYGAPAAWGGTGTGMQYPDTVALPTAGAANATLPA